MDKKRIGNKEKKPLVKSASSLEKLINYIISQNRRGVMKLVYESGYEPYQKSEEPIEKYLLRHAISIAHEEGEEGIKRILSVHPEKELILDVFSKEMNFVERIPEVPYISGPSSNFAGEDKEGTTSPIPSTIVMDSRKVETGTAQKYLFIIFLIGISLFAISLLK